MDLKQAVQKLVTAHSKPIAFEHNGGKVTAVFGNSDV